jgi:ribonucleoside-diphosphate reductase alpha chain
MSNFSVFSNKFAHDIYIQKYSMNGQEEWKDTCRRVVESVCGQYLNNETKESIFELMLSRKFIPAGRYLYASGRSYHQINNCLALRAEDSREGWADLMYKSTAALMSGAGIGVEYSKVRAENATISRTGGMCSGPLSLMQMVNEAGRHIMQGGQRRSAIWGGLNWKHPDIDKFLKCKDWSADLKALKKADLNFPMPMEFTNISVGYDTEFFVAMEKKDHPFHKHAKQVWKQNCLQAFSSAEPGMSFNFLKDSDNLRNACCEFVSDDDSDKCNLGTLWINRFASKDEFEDAVELATQFLLCGGLYSDVPYEKVREVGLKNNRIGLGVGGFYEWLLMRGEGYEVTQELHKWLHVYEDESDSAAYITAKDLGVAIPKSKRAIAPNGTIGILAESTTGIEPLFCKAYKRRYFKDGKWLFQYVIDGTTKRLLESGVAIEKIFDSYDLSFKSRVKFQADVQDYVDMAISSTCNLPMWGSEQNNEETLDKYSKELLKYAKKLRGFTCYPDGCRDGQPLTPCSIQEALSSEGQVFEEKVRECTNGVCGL